MKIKSSILALILSLSLPVGLAFAGVDADFDAEVTKLDGQKVIFVDSTSAYIKFCGTFSGTLYYGDTLVETDPSILILKRNLPLNANIHFNGGITGGGEDGFCLSEAGEAEITILTEEYVVQKGDTLKKILKNKGGNPMDYKLIAKFNGLTRPNTVVVGETLILPIY